MLRAKPAARARAPAPADPSLGNPLHAYKREFCEWTQVAGLSRETARIRETSLTWFIRWAHERGIQHPGEVSRPVLQRYQRHLYLYRTARGKPLAQGSQLARMTPLVAFFKWLTREGHILANPAADLQLPRAPRQLPQSRMSVQQVETVINQPDTGALLGIRDRAILEVLYSSGVRRAELMHLKLHEVDCERGTLMIRQGKGARDRFIPLGARACAWVRRYLLEVRPELLGQDSEVLLLTDYGEPFDKNRLSALVRGYMRQAGIEHGSCHAFRHAMATHMLEGGCDIRFIQAMLGHASLETTQIYTHVAIDQLRAVHALTHPARLERLQREDEPSPGPGADRGAEAFLAALAGEVDEDDA